MEFCFLADLDVGVGDAAHVHGGQVGGLHHLHHQRLRVEVVLELVPDNQILCQFHPSIFSTNNLLKLAQVLCGWLGRRGGVGVLLVLHELVLVILPILLGVLSKFQTLSLSLMLLTASQFFIKFRM